MPFVGRHAELNMLNRFYRTKQAALLVIYGRRRVGKTQLLDHWIKQQHIEPALYWTAAMQNASLQLRDFSQALLRFDPQYGELPSPDFGFATWDLALEHVAKLAERSRTPLVVIIDEFTYLMRSDPAVASLLQRIWDHRLSRVPNLRLVITGSLMGIMENQVLSVQAPLYGRATMQYRLRPLPFGHLSELFRRWSAEERVAGFAVCGGIPGYLNLFEEASDFAGGLTRALDVGSIMLTDPALLISDQLRDPAMYESILAAIGGGAHAWGEIARMAAIAETNLGFYLHQLSDLELIERRDPVLSSPASHRGRYYIRDPFLRFYYRFILPNSTLIQRREIEFVAEKVGQELRAFIGLYIFEELAREWVWSEAVTGGLGFVPDEVGGYWSRQRGQPVQLDVVAVNPSQKRLFIGEAKWGTGQIGREILTDLVARSQRMPQVTETGWQVQYGLFSRHGFTPATIAAAKELKARLVSLPQMEQVLTAAANRQSPNRIGKIEF